MRTKMNGGEIVQRSNFTVGKLYTGRNCAVGGTVEGAIVQ